jgi:hypothetical protein
VEKSHSGFVARGICEKMYRVSIIDSDSRDREKYDPKQKCLENNYILSHLDM